MTKPKGRHQDIVEMVCSIMDDDDGLMRPVQGQSRNAADRFTSEHQGPYEARGRASRDRIEAVHLHNSGYPKMHDELKRRRSATRITVAQRNIEVKRRNYNQCRCSNCMKYRKNAEPKNRRPASKKHERNDDARPSSSRNTKQDKQPKKKADCEMYRLKRIKSKDRKRGTDKSRGKRRDDSCSSGDDNKKKFDAKLHKPHKRDGSRCSNKGSSRHKGDETDDISASSYDSYASLDDEPMV